MIEHEESHLINVIGSSAVSETKDYQSPSELNNVQDEIVVEKSVEIDLSVESKRRNPIGDGPITSKDPSLVNDENVTHGDSDLSGKLHGRNGEMKETVTESLISGKSVGLNTLNDSAYHSYYQQMQQYYAHQYYYRQQHEVYPHNLILQTATSNTFTSPAINKLNSILDNIKDDAISVEANQWKKHVDPVTQLPYYYNEVTRATQWERPDEFVDLEEILGHCPISNESQCYSPVLVQSLADEIPDQYVQTAQFNQRTGKFDSNSATGDHWARNNLPSDRETRQLAHYFDVTALQSNREEAKRKKVPSDKVDWKKYAAEKKAKRAKLNNAWLYNNT